MYNPYADTWNRLRLQQIGFDQSPVQGLQNPMYEDPNEVQSLGPLKQPPNINTDVDATERYKQYQPQMTMQNRFAEAAQNPPNRMDFQPSALERISAGLQSFGGPGTYWGGIPVGYKANPNAEEIRSNILNRPYNEAALDYKMRIDPLRAAADDERMANTVQSNFLDRTVNRDIQERNLERMFERDQRIGGQKDIALQQSEVRGQAYKKSVDLQEWRNQHPTMRAIVDDNGYMREWDPTGQRLADYITDSDGEPIKGSELPERERIRIQVEGRDQNIQTSGEQSRITKQTPAAPTPDRSTKRHEVVYDADGNIAGYREITTDTGSQTAPPNTPKQGNKIIMYAPNGQVAWIPVEKTDQAQVDGFTFTNPQTGPDFRPQQRRPFQLPER